MFGRGGWVDAGGEVRGGGGGAWRSVFSENVDIILDFLIYFPEN